MGINRFAVLIAAAFVFAWFPLSAHAGNAGNAKRDLMFAKDAAESQRWDNLDEYMKKAATDMDGLSDSDKAPLLDEIKAIKALVTKSVEEDVTTRLDKAAKADPGMGKFDMDRAAMRLDSDEAKNYADKAVIDKLRAWLASMKGGAAPAPATPAPTTAAPSNAANGPMSGDMLTAASHTRRAHTMLEQGDLQIAARAVSEARGVLKGIPDSDKGKAPMLADLASLSQQIDQAQIKVQRDEEARRVDERVSRYIGTAENSIESGVVSDPEWIDKSQDLLGSDDTKTYMDANKIKAYQARLDALRVKLKAHNNAVAVERAEPSLKELEEQVAADPFKGADETNAHGIFTDLQTLVDRTRAELTRVPPEDPQVKASLARLAAAKAKIEASASKWTIEQMQQQIAASWKLNSQYFAGWESERLSPNAAAQRRVDGLEKTARAVSGTSYWLNSADTKETLQKYKDNPVVKSTAQEAHKTQDAAAAKLNDGFNAVLADMEKKPMPDRDGERMAAHFLSNDAAQWLAGTKYKDATVARAAALDTKWKAEAVRIEKERGETLKRMTAEASAAWPRIEASAAPEGGFDPSDADKWKGKTIKIKGYYNRTGWDFDGYYDYCVDIKGVPVAGMYAPNVKAAYADVQKRSHYGIDDHTGWDLIAVVEGKGTIKRRTKTDWKDADTHELIFKTESYVPEPCVLIRIIGLHTGPLAVGPK